MERRHERTAILDFDGDVFVVDGTAAYQRLPAIEIRQVRAALGVFVVTHPTLIGVDHFAAGSSAIAVDAIGIEEQGTLQMVNGGFIFIGIGRWLWLGRCVDRKPGRANDKQRHSKCKRTENYTQATITAFLCSHVSTPELIFGFPVPESIYRFGSLVTNFG